MLVINTLSKPEFYKNKQTNKLKHYQPVIASGLVFSHIKTKFIQTSAHGSQLKTTENRAEMMITTSQLQRRDQTGEKKEAYFTLFPSKARVIFHLPNRLIM